MEKIKGLKIYSEKYKGSQNFGLFWEKHSGRVLPIKNDHPLTTQNIFRPPKSYFGQPNNIYASPCDKNVLKNKIKLGFPFKCRDYLCFSFYSYTVIRFEYSIFNPGKKWLKWPQKDMFKRSAHFFSSELVDEFSFTK